MAGLMGGTLESLLMGRMGGGAITRPTPPTAPTLTNPPYRGDLSLPEAMGLMRKPETEQSVRDLMMARQPAGLEQVLMMRRLQQMGARGRPGVPTSTPTAVPGGGGQRFNPLDRAAGVLNQPR